jgi:hypothetical protein
MEKQKSRLHVMAINNPLLNKYLTSNQRRVKTKDASHT